MISELRLKVEKRYNATEIGEVYFTPPYKVVSPFRNGERSEIMIMSASAGILGGDIHTAEYIFKEGSNAIITSQSYEKVMDTNGKEAKRYTKIYVEAYAKAKFLPYPVIPFANSEYHSDTSIYINEKATFVYGDIFSCGRVGMGEKFLLKKYRARTQIYVEDQIVSADNTMILPEQFQYDALGQWHGYTHNGFLYIYEGEIEHVDARIERIRKKKVGSCEVGVSKAIQGIAVRVLANSGEDIYRLFQEIAGEI